MPRILPAALLTLLALILIPAQAHAAKGMEMALQDDTVFLWEAAWTSTPRSTTPWNCARSASA